MYECAGDEHFFVYKQSSEHFDFQLFLKVTEKDGLPKLICSSCVYKVISWVTFKTQCEQSDEILRTTFQCSEKKATTSSCNEQSSLDIQQNTVDCRGGVNNLFKSKNEATNDAAKSQLEHSPVQFCGIYNWNASESEVKAENNEISIVYVKQDDEAADEDEVKLKQFLRNVWLNANVQDFLKDENTFEDIDESDHSSVDLSKPIENDFKRTRTSPQKHVICDECGKSFRNPERLQSHRRGEHEGKKWVWLNCWNRQSIDFNVFHRPEVCPICQKEFNNLRALRRHRLKHSDLKQVCIQFRNLLFF